MIARIIEALLALFRKSRQPSSTVSTGANDTFPTPVLQNGGRPAPVRASPAAYRVNPDALRLMFPHLGETAVAWADALNEAFEIGGISSKRRAARFLAIVSQETGGFRVQEESLNYSVDRLRAVFGQHRITDEEAVRFGRIDNREGAVQTVERWVAAADADDEAPLSEAALSRRSFLVGIIASRAVPGPANQEALANILYGRGKAAADLGNTQPGDGWRFRGRGLLQSTGRAHYQRIADRMKMSIDAVIPWLLTVRGSAIGSAIIWQHLGGNTLADGPDFGRLVQRMNGGAPSSVAAALAHRTAYLEKWQRVLA